MESLIFHLTSLFTMINPLGAVPLFIALTESFERTEIRRVAIKASFTAFVALAIFALAGKLIFAFFGISVEGPARRWWRVVLCDGVRNAARTHGSQETRE